MNCRVIRLLLLLTVLLTPARLLAVRSIVVSVPEQKLALLEDDVTIATYPVSTSKFGLGDANGSYRTPIGEMEIASRIGADAPVGTVFKHRMSTGEILRPNTPGRDPIVTRILWLRGCERRNAGAYSRNIYIHGTPQENLIGRPASYGCIRMRSRDIVQLFNSVDTGTKIEVVNEPLSRARRQYLASR